MEAGAGHAGLSNDYGNWNDQYLRGSFQATASDRFFGEVSHQSHFGTDGVFFGLGYNRIFDENWYGLISVGTSTGGDFLPKVRLDGFLYRKWLEKKNLVTGLGFTYFDSRSNYQDHTAIIDILYYFESPWILELGGRFNVSNPGSINSNRVFSALTYGRNKEFYLTARYDYGTEAYQVVGSSTADLISDFHSHDVSAIWRQWITDAYGLNLVATYYTNPSYERYSILGGLFWDF